MAAVGDETAAAPYAPADESHLPDAVSRNGITNTNTTSWYGEPALASSPILRVDSYTDGTSRLDDDDDDDDNDDDDVAGPSNHQFTTTERVKSTFSVDSRHVANSSAAPDNVSIGRLDDSGDLDNGDGINGDGMDADNGNESSAETPDFKDLSKRADDIIANARKRLNLVDGGLRGLRSSLMSPTFSSYDSLSRTPSPASPPVDADENGNTVPVRAKSVSKPIDLRFKPARRKSAAGHARMASDTSVPTPNGSAIKGSRSLETMRHHGLSARPSMPRSPLELRSPTSLQPVNESAAVHSTSTSNIPQRAVHRSDQRFSATPVVTAGGRLSYPIPPRESSTRFRDLQSRANAIEGRMSSVRQRLREDSERRRSFQSSRPSTSTGHRSSPEDGFGEEGQGTPGDERPPPSYEDVAFMDGQQHDEQSNDFYEYQRQTERLHGSMDDYPDYDDEDDTDYHSLLEDEVVDGEYGDDDDLPPEEMAHEQRADAFDYESFILSSLLGSMDRGRASSISSTDTASTTRGPALEQDDDVDADLPRESDTSTWTGYQNGRSANASSASLSTMQSFATAAEDGAGEDESGTSSDDGIDTMDDIWPMPPTRGTTRSATHTRQNSTATVSGPVQPGMPAPPPQQPPPLTPPQQQRLLKQQQQQQLLQQQQKRPVSMALAALLTNDPASPALALNPADQALVYGMAASIRDICLRLAKAEPAASQSNGESEAESEAGEEATWRQRLDDARRILNGEALQSA